MDEPQFSEQDHRDISSMRDNDRFLKQAKQLAVMAYNSQAPASTHISPDDMYIVWFSKTLQNWKALVATDEYPGLYIEVSYNGSREEAYIDTYFKMNNIAIDVALMNDLDAEHIRRNQT